MSFFDTQNPGIGGINELTPSEEIFIQGLVAQTYSTGDLLYYTGSAFVRLPIGANGKVLTVTSGIPAWETASGGGGSGTVTSVTSANGDVTVATTTTTPVITIVSAPKLTTARTINGTSFDGTGNITVTAAAGTLTGTTLNTTVVTSSLTSVGTIGTGVWQGSAITDTYISSASTWNAKESALTFSTGLTRTVNTITVNTTQNILKISGLTSNGFVKTSGSDGTLSVDTNSYMVAGTGVTGVTGTTNRITSSGGTTPVIDISASYVGQTSITTLGTITTGVWNGTAIANANLANSTISGISLGGTLGALTATDTSLTFSGSYTGATARTVGINLANSNTWTGQQIFNTTAPQVGTATASTIAIFDASKNLISAAVATYPSLTELAYVKGVTSAIQTQLNTKGTFTLPALTAGSVLFSNGTTIAQDNANLFWDDTNNRLGIGTATPARPLQVTGDVSGGIATLERTNSSTNAVVGTAIIKGTSTGDMVDGFGTAFQFAHQDTAAVENIIGSIRTYRANSSDTTANMDFVVYAAGVSGVAMTLKYDGSVGIGTVTPSSHLDITTNSLGATQTSTSGLALVNTTAAAVGAQQISPALRFKGSGWKTTATAAAQDVEVMQYVEPLQGTTAPTPRLIFASRVNGGSWSQNLMVTNTGIQFPISMGLQFVAGQQIIPQGSSGAVLYTGAHYFSGTLGTAEISGRNELDAGNGGNVVIKGGYGYTNPFDAPSATGGHVILKPGNMSGSGTNTQGSIYFQNSVGTAIATMLDAGQFNIGSTATPTAVVDIAATSTTRASLRLRSGTAPTSPNDGDIWYDGTDLKMRVGGTTKTFTLT